MLEKYTDWFWKIFPIDTSTLEELSSAQQALVETIPYVLGAMVIFGIFAFVLASRREEPEEVILTGLDKEIEEIRKLQKLQRKNL